MKATATTDAQGKKVDSKIRSLRSLSDTRKAIIAGIDKVWLREQLAGCPSFSEWLESYAPSCRALDVYTEDIYSRSYRLDGTGADLAQFVEDFAAILSNVRIIA